MIYQLSHPRSKILKDFSISYKFESDNFVQQAQKCDDLSSSSSTMISFELSNGRLYSPLVPTDLGDDQYVEFQLDDFTGIPSSAKEEQKVSPYYNLLQHNITEKF